MCDPRTFCAKCITGVCCASRSVVSNSLRTIVHQAPLSMAFSRQEYWSGLPFSSPGDLPDPGIEPVSPALQADPLSSAPPEKQKDALKIQPPEPHPNPPTQAAGAQESESSLIPR